MGDSGVSIPPWSVIMGGNRPGPQREQSVLTFNQERRVPFGACCAQKEHAAFRSSWNRIAPRRDVCMDREIRLETSISLWIDGE